MATGTVEEINSTALRNGGTAYRIKIDGSTYGCGFNPPQVSVGDFVEFNPIKDGKYSKIEEGSLKISNNSSGSNAVASDTGGGSDRQTLIVRQSCIGYAIQSMQGDTELSTDDIIMKADELVDYVFNGLPEYLEIEKEQKIMYGTDSTKTESTETTKDPLE